MKDRQVWCTLSNPRAPGKHTRLPVIATCLYTHACTPSHKSTHTPTNMHIHNINTCEQEIEHTHADLNLEVASLLHLLLLDLNLNQGLFCILQFKVNPISHSDITSSSFYPFCRPHFLIRVFRNMNLRLFVCFFHATHSILSHFSFKYIYMYIYLTFLNIHTKFNSSVGCVCLIHCKCVCVT